MDFILFIAALALAFWVLRWVIGQLAVPMLITIVLLPFYLLWHYHPVLFWTFMVITIAAAMIVPVRRSQRKKADLAAYYALNNIPVSTRRLGGNPS